VKCETNRGKGYHPPVKGKDSQRTGDVPDKHPDLTRLDSSIIPLTLIVCSMYPQDNVFSAGPYQLGHEDSDLDELWMNLPRDLVLEIVKHVQDMDTRRAFGVFGRLTQLQLDLNLQLKPIESGYMTESDRWVRWVIGDKTYRLCRLCRRREMLVVTSNNIYTILYEIAQ
jgi:hypothetical protein